MAERQFYRLFVVHKGPITDPEEYTPAIDALVRGLLVSDPPRFFLSARAPSHRLVPVIDGEESNVWRFVSTSEIQWNHGREPQDPTHEVVFFNEHEDEQYAMLKIQFFVKPPDDPGAPPKPDDGPPKCPGILAELNLGMEAASPPATDDGTTRGQHLDRLFDLLVTAFHPDHGHIQVPGHPENEAFPMHYDVGWVTYLSRKELPVPPVLAAPASSVPMPEGTKLVATSPLRDESYPAIAAPIEVVREALRPRPIEHVPAAKPPSVPPTRVQRPSYLRDPVTGLPINPPPSAEPVSGPAPPPIVAPPMMASIPKRESFDYEEPPEHVPLPYVEAPPPSVGPSSEGGLVPQITQELPAQMTQELPAPTQLSQEALDEMDRLEKLKHAGVPFHEPEDPKKGDKK